MFIKAFEFSHIKFFRTLLFDFDKTSVLAGKNDHGKSSILQVIDMVLNRLDERVFKKGSLSPDIAQWLQPIIPSPNKTVRVTIHFVSGNYIRQLFFTFGNGHSVAVHETADEQETTREALRTLKSIRRHNRFFLMSYEKSALLQALHRLERESARHPGIQFVLAAEEPESLLDPQNQKELYQRLQRGQRANLRIIVTTHSPYIIAETPCAQIGLVRKHGRYSQLHVSARRDGQDASAIFDNEITSLMFFSEKVIIVEGESDARVIKFLLRKRFRKKAQSVVVLTADGNKNFPPFLRMLRVWQSAGIPHLIVTDFDSLTKRTHRALLTGAKSAGFPLHLEALFHETIDAALDKNEAAFSAVACIATDVLAQSGLNVFVFTSDLEHALITGANKEVVARLLGEFAGHQTNYKKGFDLEALKRLIGSKGIPFNPLGDPPFKKPFIHGRIAETIDFATAHPDIRRLVESIRAL